MLPEPLDIPHDLNFTCRRCGACCHGRIVELLPGEKEKLESLGPAASPRGAMGQPLFVPLGGRKGPEPPIFRLAQVDGHCVFLEDDDSCSIHNLHGYQAKPLACRQFPLLFAREPEGVVVSASFACPSVIDRHGTPLRQQEGDIRALLEEGSSGQASGRGTAPVRGFSIPDRIILAAQIGMDWHSYQALERAIIDLLEDESHTLAVRLLAVRTLVDGAVAEYCRGTKTTSPFVVWMEHMISGSGQRWIYEEASAGRNPSPRSRRAVLGPLVATQEEGYAREMGATTPNGRIRGVAAILRGRGRVRLASIAAEVRVEAVEGINLDHDTAEFRPLLVRYLVELLRRKLLLKHPNLLKGTQRLLVRFALVKWYAAALAVAHGKSLVGVEELRGAMGALERCYDQEDRLTSALDGSPWLRTLTGLQLDMLSSAADLVLSPADGARRQAEVLS